MDKHTYHLIHKQARTNAAEHCMTAPDGYMCIIQPPTRTISQNYAQWPYLEGFSKQLQWPVNGNLEWLTKDEWKDVLTCAFESELSPRLAAGFDGGVVMLGKRTSQFGKKKFAEWMEFLIAAAALKGVEPIFRSGDKRWREI